MRETYSDIHLTIMKVSLVTVKLVCIFFSLHVFIPASWFVTVLVHELLVQGVKLLHALLRLAARGNLAVDQNLLVQNRE